MAHQSWRELARRTAVIFDIVEVSVGAVIIRVATNFAGDLLLQLLQKSILHVQIVGAISV